jgi:hypothetical protein
MYRTILSTSLTAALLSLNACNASTSSMSGYSFNAYVVNKNDHRISEHTQNGRPTLFINDGDEYSIVIKNPLPVRVGVAVTVDGLNTIDGERTTSDDASKWVIEANSSITIRGWQTGTSKLRRFVFTRQSESYADWKQERDKANYTRNLGVIGIAYFWNSDELRDVLSPPQPFAYTDDEDVSRELRSAPEGQSGRLGAGAPAASESCKRKDAAPSAKAEAKAGTGMGNAEHHSVERVEFTYDTGMYANKDAIRIYYEFAKKAPQPQPFLDDDNDEGYAPEMHTDNATPHQDPFWMWW